MKILTYKIGSGIFWFRLFGYGILITDTSHKDYYELFSYRNKIGCIKIGKYIVKFLK